MTTIGGKLLQNLQEQKLGERLGIGGWQLLKVQGTDELSGTIRLKLPSAAGVKAFEKAFQGSVVKVGDMTATLQISNLTLAKLPQCRTSCMQGGSPAFTRGAPPGL